MPLLQFLFLVPLVEVSRSVRMGERIFKCCSSGTVQK